MVLQLPHILYAFRLDTEQVNTHASSKKAGAIPEVNIHLDDEKKTVKAKHVLNKKEEIETTTRGLERQPSFKKRQMKGI